MKLSFRKPMRLRPTSAAGLLPVLALLLVACATTKPAAQTAPADTTRPATATAPGSPAGENLTRYRPVFTATPVGGAGPGATGSPATPPAARPAAPRPAAPPPAPTNQVNAQVEQRLRDQAYMNEKVKYASGYRVRAYQGIEREQAMSIRRQIIGRYPDETDYITVKQPVYRLYIGDYLTKLEAARGLARVRQFAPRAEIESAQVLLNKVP